MTEKTRPVLPDNLVKPLQQYAVSHNINLTAAVAVLLTKILKQEKYLK